MHLIDMSEKPVNIDKKDNLTDYVSGMLEVRLSKLPPNMQEEMIRDAEALSAIGVNSEEDHKDFMYVLLHTRKIAEDISERKFNSDVISKLSSLVYSNRISNPIDTIFNFYRAVGKGLNEMGIPIKKTAYPLGQSGLLSKNPRNVRKWMKSMHEIYLMVHHGEIYNSALNHVTAEWDIMEKNDFKNWLSFYQEGAHEKYVTAAIDDDLSYLQFGGDGAPMIPFSALTGTLPKGRSMMPNMNRLKHNVEEDEEEAQAAADAEVERLEVRDKKVKSVGGRLRSVLRLLSDEDVQEVLDGKLDCSIADFVKQIQELQRHIMLVPLKNKKSSILEDIIIQKGNRLIAQGFPIAGDLMRKMAQDAPMGAEPDLGEDVGDPPSVEDLEGGAPEAISDEMGDMGSEMDEVPDFEDETEWVQKFKNNINNINEDRGSVKDLNFIDDLVEFTVEAQALPTEPPTEEAMMPQNEEVTMEVEEDPELEVTEEPDPTDPALDLAPEGERPEESESGMGSLDNVTIEGVVERLERVSNILKNREIPRELAWIDFMLDKLGLASYFPALAEATKSALESNQYMSSRVEDIVSRLRGSITPETPIELTTTEPEAEATSDTINQIRQNLESGEQKERQKKEQKQKGLEEEAPAPNAIPEELQQPLNVETAPPTPVRPAPVR